MANKPSFNQNQSGPRRNMGGSNRQPSFGPGRKGGPMGSSMIVEKPKNFKESMKNLFHYLKKYNVLMLIAVIFAIGGTIFNIVGPKLLGNMTNEVQIAVFSGMPINLDKIKEIAIILIVLYVLSYIFNLAQGIIMNIITQRTSRKLRKDISAKLNRLPLNYFDTRSYGDILSIVTNDVDMIGQTLNRSLASLITSITSIIGVIVMMLTINVLLAVIIVALVPLSMALMMLIMKFSQKYFRVYQNGLGSINGHIEEIYSGHNVVKVFNANHNAKKEFDELNKNLYEGSWKSQFFSGLMMPIMNLTKNISYLVVGVVGGILAVSGKILIGGIQSMLAYVQKLSKPLNQIAQSLNQLQSTAAAAERVFNFLEAEELPDESNLSDDVDLSSGNIEFSHVKFGYVKDKIIINDFNIKINDGQKIAIVGPTGAGKTTIVNLLMRFYELNSGDILINGISTKKIKRQNVHSLFGMVLQDAWLFKGSIKENLTYGNKDVTMDDIINACKLSNVHHFIEALPNGYDHVIDENSSISQGQKQLLTIARATIANPPMLILDEATSNVDTRTEILIQKAMDALMQGRTTFIIAHRLSTIKNADLILVMKDGDVIETGTHEELLAQNGFYSELYNSQFDTIEE